MPKLKTKKGVAKRFKISKKGKVQYLAGGKGHLLTSKKTARIRRLRRVRSLKEKKAIRCIKRMLPYS